MPDRAYSAAPEPRSNLEITATMYSVGGDDDDLRLAFFNDDQDRTYNGSADVSLFYADRFWPPLDLDRA